MTEVQGRDGSRIDWRGRGGAMLLRATLAQNVGTGCAFGGLGVSILALQDRYHASLGTATMGLSLTVLFMTALGPLIASLLARWGLRAVMSTGVVISMFGYLALAFAPNIALALAACALLIGPGAALFAALPPAVLAGGWFPHARGKVMGIAYLPLFVTIIPLLGVGIIQQYGLTSFFVSLAAVHLLLLPLVLGVIEPPYDASEEQGVVDGPGNSAGRVVIMGTAIFWLIVLGDGILNGTAIAGSAHMLPIVEGYGASVEMGAVLLSISGVASIIGSLLAGIACDRIGSAKTLGLAGLGFAIAWAIMAFTGWLPALVVSAFLLGICGASVFPPISALSVEVFGVEALPKVLGLLGVMTMPFTISMSPAAGWLRDVSGSYGLVFAGLVTACMIAAITFFAMSRHLNRRAKADLVVSATALIPASSTGSVEVSPAGNFEQRPLPLLDKV